MSGRDGIPTTAQVKDSTSLDGATALDEAEFDRWLAQHDAEVAGKALRDAAADLMGPECCGSLEVPAWLRGRATEIEGQR